MQSPFRVIVSIGLLSFLAAQLASQSDSLYSEDLDSIVITAGRLTVPYLSIPASVTHVELDFTNKYLSHKDLSEALSGVPGLFSLDGQNYAQDLRISLRGFGSRSAFGIRGLKLIVDGIPETTPDGQGQLDNISVGDISSIQVLQGSSGSQYGNAAGGVIEISTLRYDKDGIDAGIHIGSYGWKEYHIGASQTLGATLIQLSSTHQRSNGYRDHSRLRQTNILSKVTHHWDRSKLVWQGSVLSSPTAEDPGGINIDQARAIPRSARDRNLSFDAGEGITHWKTSLSYKTQLNTHLNAQLSSFYSKRIFEGRLPFGFGGIVDLNRGYGGLRAQLNFNQTTATAVNKMSIGYEYLSQRDNRDRFVNDEGIKGLRVLSQIEKFDNSGIYIIDQWSNDQWTLRGSLRYDHHAIGVEDKFLSNGDQSGDRRIDAFNYSVGATYQYSDGHAIFSNWSTSFEIPALSELSANPSQAGGFNDMLDPTESKTIEVGLKGGTDYSMKYTVSIFSISTVDELIPFELIDFAGRTFFRNAGSTSRRGIELSLAYNLIDDLRLQSSYGYSDFYFDDYTVDGESLSDSPLPGIPRHALSSSLVYSNDKLFLKLSSQYFSRISVKDDYSVSVSPYHISNLRFGYQLKAGAAVISPFVAISNVFSTEYFDNLRLNAFGSRHYEPAATRNWQVGVSVSWE